MRLCARHRRWQKVTAADQNGGSSRVPFSWGRLRFATAWCRDGQRLSPQRPGWPGWRSAPAGVSSKTGWRSASAAKASAGEFLVAWKYGRAEGARWTYRCRMGPGLVRGDFPDEVGLCVAPAGQARLPGGAGVVYPGHGPVGGDQPAPPAVVHWDHGVGAWPAGLAASGGQQVGPGHQAGPDERAHDRVLHVAAAAGTVLPCWPGSAGLRPPRGLTVSRPSAGCHGGMASPSAGWRHWTRPRSSTSLFPAWQRVKAYEANSVRALSPRDSGQADGAAAALTTSQAPRRDRPRARAAGAMCACCQRESPCRFCSRELGISHERSHLVLADRFGTPL
jgi:hypothetical protein